MTYFEIILLALALSVDACVVSFSYGLCFEKGKTVSVPLAVSTGLFQAIMPVLGYFLAFLVKDYISPFSKIIIFTIFVFLGIKFIKESFEEKKEPKCIDFMCLILIGIATSIDAFSAGISLLLYGNHIIKPAILIGFVTFINSMLGFWIGNHCKKLPSRVLEIFAGAILILLGIKAFI